MGKREGTTQRQKRGSWLSEKQLAHAVINHQQVEFIFLTVSPVKSIKGWVAGWDDFHWFVVSESARTYLIHKSSVYVEILPEQHNELPPEVEAIAGPFRGWVRSNIYA